MPKRKPMNNIQRRKMIYLLRTRRITLLLDQADRDFSGQNMDHHFRILGTELAKETVNWNRIEPSVEFLRKLVKFNNKFLIQLAKAIRSGENFNRVEDMSLRSLMQRTLETSKEYMAILQEVEERKQAELN